MTIDMKKLIPPPEREAFEREIAHLFVNGNLSDIARLLQKDQSLVSKAFNPYSTEKHNPVYVFVQYLWAMDAIREDLAGEVLNIVLREREKWQQVPVQDKCPAKLTGRLVKEIGEMIEAEIEGLSFEKQIDEVMDVINAAEEKKDNIIALRNKKHFGECA